MNNEHILAIKKFILKNYPSLNNKLVMHYRVIRKKPLDENFYQDSETYANKYESGKNENESINLKTAYLDYIVSDNYYEDSISNSIINFENSMNSAVNEIIDYLEPYMYNYHINYNECENVKNNYNENQYDHYYMSLDNRIKGTENINDTHYINENTVFNEIDEKIIETFKDETI